MGDDPTDTTSLRAACEELLEELARAAVDFPARFLPFEGGITAADLPEEGAGLPVVLDELRAAVAHGSAVNAPGFCGWITVGGTTAPIVAELATAVASGQRYLQHAFNHLEHVGLRWLADLCGIPPAATGVFTSGGSTANLIGLGAARQAAYERVGIDVGNAGQWGTPRGRIYASELAHRTIHRSAAVLGLGRGCCSSTPPAWFCLGHLVTSVSVAYVLRQIGPKRVEPAAQA